MTIPNDLLAKVEEAITHYPVSKRSASLPLLHLFQEHFGYIADESITWIAAKLELQPINVLELVTFYPMFRRQPAGAKHFRVCRTLSCALPQLARHSTNSTLYFPSALTAIGFPCSGFAWCSFSARHLSRSIPAFSAISFFSS